jgi:hypothetical protein
MIRSATALAAALLLTTAATAHAESAPVAGGTVSVPNVILAADYCVEVPVAYDFSGMDLGYTWTLDLDSNATGGAFWFGDSGDAGTTSATWCPADLTGSFYLIGTLKVVDAEYNDVSTDLLVFNFTVKKRTTTATLRIADTTPKAGKIFRVKGCLASSGRRDAYREMAIQYRRPAGTWHKLVTTWTDEVGCFSEETFSKKPGKAYLRVHVSSTSSRTGAYSKVITSGRTGDARENISKGRPCP